MIANIPMPTRNISNDAEANTRLLNSENGMTGSEARNSIGIKMANRMAEITNPMMTRVASQASPSPTQESASSSATRDLHSFPTRPQSAPTRGPVPPGGP